jgi:CubicO group peptidase (beta-lactamase class C family)
VRGTPQDRVQKEAKRLLEAGVSGNVFPGGVACVGWGAGNRLEYVVAAAGRLTPRGALVKPDTPYDLASLTKPIVAMTALRLVSQGRLALDGRVESLLPDVRGGAGGTATVEQLLRHRSGLAAWGGLYLDVPHDRGSSAARRWILAEAARRGETAADAKTLYSDLGYMLAGEVVARAGGSTLDRVVEREVTAPLGIASDVYYASALSTERKAELFRRAAPTERCEWRGKVLTAEVHDENCSALGGVSGHAGMFGNASGVAVFGQAVLAARRGESELWPAELIERALEDRPGGSSYRLGWDVKQGEPSAAGRRMGPRTFGHLGYTGTSLWCDPDRMLVVVLLTNRVHPSRSNEKIRVFRPAFHDGILAVM